MKQKILYWLLLTFLLIDISYSFLQHLYKPLDGDMAWNIVPSPDVQPVLENPFGTETILKNKQYANPNRFFCHWIFRKYFISVPVYLQKFTEPIKSVYLSSAIAKTLMQIALITLLAMIISGTMNVLKIDFMIAAVLVTPFFQTNGYQSHIGIIDPCPTYAFFYALPAVFLLLYFLPLIFKTYHEKKYLANTFFAIICIPLAVIVCLSGPLNPGVVLIVALLMLFAIVRRSRSVYANTIPKNYWLYLLPISILAAYSLYIGSYNSITIANHIPLRELYSRIPMGIFYQVTSKLGWPLLLLILSINIILICKRYKTTEGKKIVEIFKWVGVFALLYILLLPLGGYRAYRPNVLRYDTILPITLSMIIVFGLSTVFLYKNMNFKEKKWYAPLILTILLMFTLADEPRLDNNECERQALKEIANSQDTLVELHNDCNVLSWEKITDPNQSELNAQLLNLWGITKTQKLYYSK